MTTGITKSMIINGYNMELVQLASNPYDGCLTCQIGGHWFNFTGTEDENMSPDEYKSKYAKDIIIDNILSTLYDFETDDVFEDEYWHYYFYLKEHGC